jgi:dTDP-4-amino-4,6-dideoxygalactose transaminase
VTDWRIPLSDLDYGSEEANAVQRVIAGKWLSMGPEVQAFEQEFAAMQEVKHALAVSSATAGLHLALLALGVGPGDEVIQPALNFVAAANMTVALGGTPVFADICCLDEPTIDPSEVERLISPRTKAVIVMHYGGSLCRMAALTEICTARGIAIVEDACHAVGVAYHDARNRWPNGVMAGSIGDISAFSFFSNKNIASGEGGMVVTTRTDLAEHVRLLRSHGMTSLTWDRHTGHAASYDVVRSGYNYRLDELHAALGRAQLKKLEHNNQRRRDLLISYREAMRPLGGWIMPFADTIKYSSGHLMVVVAPEPQIKHRAVHALCQSGIQSSMHYPCVAEFTGFETGSDKDLKLTREFTSRAITLPLYPTLDPDRINDVVEVLRGL